MPSLSNLLTALAVAASSSLLPLVVEAKACPPLGAVLPPPREPSKSDDVQRAIKRLEMGLEAVAPKLNKSGVSLAVKSIHEDEMLFSWHHTPTVLSGIGTDKIGDDTIYRVGSVSKMFPILAALQHPKIHMQDSVLKYIPELRNSSKQDPMMSAAWEDITVESLANHLSGLGTDIAFDLALLPAPWTKMGLPEVKKDTAPRCSGLPGTKPCTAKDLINDVNRRPPVYGAYTGPVYSNIAYALLGMVVEAATGTPFADVVKEKIYDVVGMKGSSFDGPVDDFDTKGFVPAGEEIWNVTLGVFEAAGGMFSSTADLIAFTEAIHSNRLLSPRQTRQWMKPKTHTSAMGYSVGDVWEILRSDNVTSDGRVLDVYTKSGDLGLYHTLVGIVPDYDIVLTVLTGGEEVTMDPNARTKLFSGLITTLIPAIEQAGKDEASAEGGFVGTFVDEESNSTIVLGMDDGPGLSIKEFSVRGFDVLSNIGKYSLNSVETGGASGDDNKPKPKIEGRLYPTKPGDAKAGMGGISERFGWRATFEAEKTEEQRAAAVSHIFFEGAGCETWFGFDRSAYNFLSLAEFVFHRSKGDGEVYAIENPAFNVNMAKVSSDSGGSDGGGNSTSGAGGEEGRGDADESAPPPGSSASTLRSGAVLAVVIGTVLMAVQL